MRKLLLAPLPALCVHAAHSQTFESGYLVLQRGDTLRGEIENAFWEEPPATVRFRATATAPLLPFKRRAGCATNRQIINWQPFAAAFTKKSATQTFLPGLRILALKKSTT
jgi:hypothetical protein